MGKNDLDDILADLAIADSKAGSKGKAGKKGGKNDTKAASTAEVDTAFEMNNEKYEFSDIMLRGLGKRPADLVWTTRDGRLQTSPPTIPVDEFYTQFPVGRTSEYALESALQSASGAEARERDLVKEEHYQKLREAAEVHRQVRQDIQKYIRPGAKLADIAYQLEQSTKALIKSNGLQRGWGFPTGLSINHVAAHFSPNPGDKTILKADDVMKVDFGVHVDGHIIDCAFTAHFNPKFDPLVEAVREATEAGVKAAGIDMRLGDIGGAIQEVMESYEIELDGQTHRVKCIRNLMGHNITPYRIHGGKSVPIYNNHDQTKMEEGEMFAIETFGSTGRGNIAEDGDCSHFMRSFTTDRCLARSDGAKKLFNTINSTFSTLPFCRRWLDEIGQKNHGLYLKQLVDSGNITAHPPLVENKGAYTAQFEHTILLRPTCKEVLTPSYDY